MRRPWPELDSCITEKNNYTSHCNILSSSIMAQERPQHVPDSLETNRAFLPENSVIGGVLISVVE